MAGVRNVRSVGELPGGKPRDKRTDIFDDPLLCADHTAVLQGMLGEVDCRHRLLDLDLLYRPLDLRAHRVVLCVCVFVGSKRGFCDAMGMLQWVQNEAEEEKTEEKERGMADVWQRNGGSDEAAQGDFVDLSLC